MYKACQTKQSAERQHYIERCFISMLHVRTYHDISISALCEEAHVPRKTFYRYFDSKEDILHAIADHSVEEYESFPGPYGAGDYRTTQKDMEKIFQFWGARRDLLDALGNSGIRMQFVEYIFRRADAEHLGARLVTRPEVDERVNMTTIFTIYGLFSLIFRWHAMGCRSSPKQMSLLVSQMLTQPLYTLLE